MIQVCYYKGCGVVYGEKEPLSDKRETHGLCPKHLEISLREIKVEMEKMMHKTGSFRVLIVEDSTLFRQLFKEVFIIGSRQLKLMKQLMGERHYRRLRLYVPILSSWTLDCQEKMALS